MKRALPFARVLILLSVLYLSGCATCDSNDRLKAISDDPDKRLTAISELRSRNDLSVNDPEIVDWVVCSCSILLDKNAEWKNREKARKYYETLKNYGTEVMRRRQDTRDYKQQLQSCSKEHPCLKEPSQWGESMVREYENDIVIDSLIRHLYKPDIRLRTLYLGVKLGIPGSAEKLNDVLMRDGDKEMAEDFLNSGSRELYKGGKRWANERGYEIKEGMGSHRVNWGSF